MSQVMARFFRILFKKASKGQSALAVKSPISYEGERSMLENFRADILNLADHQIINKYYLAGPAYALSDDLHYAIRESVSNFFSVEFTDVCLVGSAKLGFSIKPERRFQQFCDSSDIDIVLISSSLFERVWIEVFNYVDGGAYWPKKQSFMDYHFRGWIRPDKLPLNASFPFTGQWWNFFEEMSGSGQFGPYKVRGGLYHSRQFLESYQRKCFEECRAIV